MDFIAPHFKLQFGGTADPAAIVQVGNARFTILTGRLIRMEYSPSGVFIDRASQAIWYRKQPVPAYRVKQSATRVKIETDALILSYEIGQPFSAESLWIEVRQGDALWHYGDADPGNLGGTARTLDGVEGATPLSLGLVSRSGWSVVDDSASLVFDDRGWLQQRGVQPGQLDLYFMGYGHDYLACLRDFNLISGSVPMIPRWVLGNWWSRYWEYSQQELTQLIQDFQAYEIPLSVCIVDMDWHITRTGNDSTGWTGYSWNRNLFPDPDGLLQMLHQKGLKVALNLHPAEGIHRHEDMYREMCQAVGQDADLGEPVQFDIPEPSFVDSYFKILHHPMEARGIDFWWMDWQQGKMSKVPGLDPLWWLNHLHFYDLGRGGTRRSFIFSRWGGLGNHRYPIGFSGDTVVSWDSLAFQPYFTATASNVNYGWWSHDIGGHMSGVEDAELNARWVQMGVFLPVLRLHATKNPYQDRRPWRYDAETFQVLRDAMQLRHELIPYIYSMAWRYHHENIPPILPMYYTYPEQEEAYACPNQYQFGSQMVVAPFLNPKDEQTRLSRSVVWLPEGDWYDFFNGQYYTGSSWHAVYGTLREIPLFAKGGAIVPQAPKTGWGGTDTPEHLILNVFPGADGSFDLYDDEGNTNHYLQGRYAITPIRQDWDEKRTSLVVGPVEGDASMVPARRKYELCFRGFNQPAQVQVTVNGQVVEANAGFAASSTTLTIRELWLTPGDRLQVILEAQPGGSLANRADARETTCLKLIECFRMESGVKASLASRLPALIAGPAELGRYQTMLKEPQLRALLETITGAGMEYTCHTGSPLVILWNNREDEQVTYQISMTRQHEWWLHPDRYPWKHGVLPRFASIQIRQEFGAGNPWMAQAAYYGIYTLKVGE